MVMPLLNDDFDSGSGHLSMWHHIKVMKTVEMLTAAEADVNYVTEVSNKNNVMSNIYSQFLVTYIVVIKWLFMVEKFHGVATSCLLEKLCGLLTSVEFSINVYNHANL